MRPRKAEREAMADLLSEDHLDVETLAADALSLAWDSMMRRDWWTVAFHQPGVGTTLHGPFESQAQASKYVKKDLVASGPEPGQARVIRLLNGHSTEGSEE